jgi:hypothetical protein
MKPPSADRFVSPVIPTSGPKEPAPARMFRGSKNRRPVGGGRR